MEHSSFFVEWSVVVVIGELFYLSPTFSSCIGTDWLHRSRETSCSKQFLSFPRGQFLEALYFSMMKGELYTIE